jgi:hypothetical protein
MLHVETGRSVGIVRSRTQTMEFFFLHVETCLRSKCCGVAAVCWNSEAVVATQREDKSGYAHELSTVEPLSSINSFPWKLQQRG